VCPRAQLEDLPEKRARDDAADSKQTRDGATAKRGRNRKGAHVAAADRQAALGSEAISVNMLWIEAQPR
jgi:hypothetical protein